MVWLRLVVLLMLITAVGCSEASSAASEQPIPGGRIPPGAAPK